MMNQPPAQESPKFFALDIADAFLASQHQASDPAHTMLVRQTAFLVGEHVADCGHAGDWGQLNAKEFYEQVECLGEHQVIGVTLALIGFFGWLGSHGYMRPEVCAVVVRDIVEHCPDVAFLYRFADSGLKLLETTAIVLEAECSDLVVN